MISTLITLGAVLAAVLLVAWLGGAFSGRQSQEYDEEDSSSE